MMENASMVAASAAAANTTMVISTKTAGANNIAIIANTQPAITITVNMVTSSVAANSTAN